MSGGHVVIEVEIPGVGAWRDISTAPKDGTRIWVYATGRAHGAEYTWQGSAEWLPGIVAGWLGLPDDDCVPTHWMPLAPPPK